MSQAADQHRRVVEQLTGEQLFGRVSVDDAREGVREAYIGFSAGRFIEPPRVMADGGRFISMACIDRDTQAVVTKTMTIRPENVDRGFPSHSSVVLAFDRDGHPCGVIDGNAVTTRRTGAASGVATELLAEPQSAVLAVIGAGEQAAEQIRAVIAVRPIQLVRIHSLDRTASTRLARLVEQDRPGIVAVAVQSPEAAVRDADVVCCVTSATAPLFELDVLSPTVHVNAIGAFRPDMIELPPALTTTATSVLVDSRTAAMSTAGDIIAGLALDESLAARLVEIGQLLTDPSFRRTGRTCFKSVGIAAQDFAITQLALDHPVSQSD